MPIITFAATTNSPSPRNGLYHRTSPSSSRNQMPQISESKPSSRLTTGLASSSSSCHGTPRPEQHREEDSDEHHRRAEVALRHDEHERHAGDEHRLPQLDHRLRRDAILREHAREHQHDRELRELRGLAEPVAGDRQPAAGARRRAGAGAEAREQRERAAAAWRRTPARSSTR